MNEKLARSLVAQGLYLSTGKIKFALRELAKNVVINYARPAFREFQVVTNQNKKYGPNKLL